MSLRLKRSGGALVGATLAVVLAALMLALFPAVAEAQTEDKNTSSVVVRPGDSLWSISEERLGPNATPQQIYNKAARIYALNSERIGEDPNLIYPGEGLLLEPAREPVDAPAVAGRTGRDARPAVSERASKKGAAPTPSREAAQRTSRDLSREVAREPSDASTQQLPELARPPIPKPVAEPAPKAASDEVRWLPQGRLLLAALVGTAAVWGAMGLILVVALMAWKLLMRRTTREDGERWGIPTGYYGAPAAHRNNAPLASRPGSPGARDREGARGEGIPQPPGPEQRDVPRGTGDTPAANGGRNAAATASAAAARQVRRAKLKASPRNGLANDGLGAYALLSWLGFPKSYRGKIMLVAFLGTHAPLIALVLYLLLLGSSIGFEPALRLFVVVVSVTLIGTGATLLALRGLLAPMSLTVSALELYIDDRKVPALPAGYTDEAGKLMAGVQYAIGHLAETVRSLEDLSATDHLTGLLNRRQGEKLLAEEVAKLRRGTAMVTLGVVDVNKLKHINDTYGHQAGDACIRHVADVIRRDIRQGDWLARWGGDEFVLILRDADSFALTEAVLQRIVKDLKDSPVRLPRGEELTLSVTMGASRYSGEEDLWELLDKADEAMYEAKREGRSWILFA